MAATRTGWQVPPQDGQPALRAPHFPPTARRVIYLCMAEGPSQIETFDHKPELEKWFDKDLPDSVRQGQRITTMTSGQTRFPVAPSLFRFAQHGQSGAWVSELLPQTARIVDELAIVRSVRTDAINHDPAITFLLTGAEIPGRPSLGAWVSHGLGSRNRDLPAFVVLHSTWTGRKDAQALYTRLWGAGFLPSRHQGVAFRSSGDPVLYLRNPEGIDPPLRRRMLDTLERLNRRHLERDGDPETATRIAQYEMAWRMQHSIPELEDLSREPEHVLKLYGPEVHTPGTFARNCLLARRLAERDVRFVQVFIRGWDQHFNLPKDMAAQCRDTDHGCAGLILDLKQRGLLDDTLVVWGGEFGRTVYCQGPLTRSNYGRDHHPYCFTMWFAGGGIRPGLVYGATDDFSYNVVQDPVHLHDVNATILHCLGIDHERLTYRYQGRDFRLTDVHGHVVRPILA
ncbi:MAG: DUF1501 domain-containing protein [Planctomycetes bacterium]|nr:DUF1501 domain-containing protein [Planctomycetota bacterium]